MYASPQIASPKFLLLSANCKSENFYKILYNSVSKVVLKVVFLFNFYYEQILYSYAFADMRKFEVPKSPKDWVLKLQIRKVSHLRNVLKSHQLFKSANLRFAELISSCPPLISTRELIRYRLHLSIPRKLVPDYGLLLLLQYVLLFLLVKIHFFQTEVSSFSSVVKKKP
jgi:hypothetical protein